MNWHLSLKMYPDMTLWIMGGFNTKVGNERIYYVDVLGYHGLGERNENGELLIRIAQS